jgi:hypothetical protein
MKRQILMAAMFLTAVVVFSNMSFAHDISAGCGSNVNSTVSDETAWKTLCSTTINLTDGSHTCVATASAEAALTTGSSDNDYLFVISNAAGGPGLDSAWERKIELSDNAGAVNDPDATVVSTVRFFSLGAGTHTFYWLARPEAAADANLTVNDYSMGVVCTDGV